MLKWLLKLLLDQSGQVGGTQDDTTDTDGSTTDEEQSAAEAGEGEDQETSGEGEEESFVDDPDALSDELKNSPEFKGMQRAFSKKMARFRGSEDKLNILDRIQNDADYRRQFVLAAAQGTGLTVGQPNQNGTETEDNSLAAVAKAALPPGYAEAMPELGDVIAKVVENAIKPMKAEAEQHRTQALRTTQKQEWDKAVTELSETDPEWDDESEDIGELNEWLKGPEMFHPVWGNKLVMLRKLAKGDGYATTEAAKRMRTAARNKTQTGKATGPISIVDIHKQIEKADGANSKWKIAANFAMDELKKNRRQA